MSKGVLVDITRCVGCGSCVVACKMWNNLKYHQDTPNVGKEAKLAADEWTVVKKVEAKVEASVEAKAEAKKNEKIAWRFVKEQCLHCAEPACASACFSKAFQKTKAGPVVYDVKLCVGCRYCMLACPFNIPKYEWDKTFPQVHKCQMCAGRLNKGEAPACVGVCPAGALVYGERKELIARAREKISAGDYINHIYGEKEAGGTAWLYLSDVPFENLGFRTDITTKPIPHYTESILSLTPAVGLGWGAVLTGLYVYNRRRNEIAKEEHEQTQGKKKTKK